MTRPLALLGAICVGALILRLLLLPLIAHPGIADPNHYYNLGLRLADGHGFTIDYIWQYSLPPDALAHPEEHWMPLTAVIAAGPLALFGESVAAALLPFILIGALLPALSYWAARQLDLGPAASLFAAGCTALLPEFVLNSLRTDTTILMALCVGTSILLLVRGLRRDRLPALIGSGIAAGLAYLTRSDGALLLPMLAVTLIAAVVWGKQATGGSRRARWRAALVIPAAAAVVAAPWIARNLAVLGTPTTPEARSMFFFTHHDDHYAYGREFSLETLLAAQTPAEIINKRLFEMAAAAQMMAATLDVFLPVAVAGGALLLIGARDGRRQGRWLALSPALILLFGGFVAYTIFLPYKSQAGSFKKFWLAIVPLIIPLAAYALERTIPERRLRFGAMGLVIALLAANAFQLVRTDARFTAAYLDEISAVAERAQTLPDTNGDGTLVLMVQDPYMLRYVGIQSVIYPFEDRATILQVAARYGVDYLLMPPNRPALDPLYTQLETDSRIRWAADLPGTQYVFYAYDAVDVVAEGP
ncbi:MAG: hypothetical protein GYB67_13685 [Chloroflexi bacterium]|nr:hypothetical protein [Chloroflexota bacterium]